MAAEITAIARPARPVVEVSIDVRTHAGTVEMLVRGLELHRVIRLSSAEAAHLFDDLSAAVASTPIDVQVDVQADCNTQPALPKDEGG